MGCIGWAVFGFVFVSLSGCLLLAWVGFVWLFDWVVGVLL